jgi:hypothetical protein
MHPRMKPGLCVCRAERMRWRSTFVEGAAGRYANAAVLIELSKEAHTVRDVGETVWHESA